MYEQGVYDLLMLARSLVNSLSIALRIPPEMLGIISSYLTEEDLFSASRACRYWRSVLISSPSLWTRVSCRRVPQTITSLERCGTLPIQLLLDPGFSDEALDYLLLHENKIVSLTVNHECDEVPRARQLLMSCKPHLEQLHIYALKKWQWETLGRAMDGVLQGLSSLRKLFISRYPLLMDQLAAPNLVHLALERTSYRPSVTIILDMLRQCPLLETLFLLSYSSFSSGPARSHSPVRLPHLRSIEVGVDELRSGLITHLDFPKSTAAGFRNMYLAHVWGNIPPAIMAAIQHVLTNIDIYRITLAIPPHTLGNLEALVRFEGSQGSLEMTIDFIHPKNLSDLFGPQGVLFSHKPHIADVRELHIIDFSLIDRKYFRYFSRAMPNVVSISFFNCSELYISELLAPSHPSSLPFPHLECVMVLGSESELEEVAWGMRDLGVRLKTLIIGRGPGCDEHDILEDYTILEDLVDDLRIGYPAQTWRWAAGNEIASIWSTVMEDPEQVSQKRNLVAHG